MMQDCMSTLTSLNYSKIQMKLGLGNFSTGFVISFYRQCLLANSTEACLNNFESFQANINLPHGSN